MKRKIIKRIIIAGGTMFCLATIGVIGFAIYIAQSMSGWSHFEFAVGEAAVVKIHDAGIPVPAGITDAMYWYECVIDHTAYMSYTLPRGEVLAHVNQVMKHWGASGVMEPGATSEYAWINAGPKKKPSGWKNHYWAVSSVHDGIMYEERYRFICGDRETGRIYISTWSE